MIETMLSISMFFAGGVGSMCAFYLKRISTTLDAQAKVVTDIDKRVVRCESKIEGFQK